ncbi:TPA_exp: Uncharacterized protein A8136_5941 [Trichophyton benhamiae CBS 112371]|uniref:AB hydrolase-1 domain-containing protein n=1 Tax=Arthroderma benhamiae (strain ATCC MYA-4681 / CBS 112371) TaxID=663331 RepID=D4B5I1_ARTBC|nr:uncharacterized protein ARB_03721 [Trichophyton benhamiae CBS 112371]EFE29425.1 hypothetical protein ARB_03721 [Trichophyton benhamiae CBS 112371]DAA72706.1 TPA_exp: Uncharacterized protein A8136_5941 [Trichophyton benhamiae CBS 112371]
MSKPTIALVPGAWHTPAHYEEFLAIFEKAGYPTACLQLPGVDSAAPKDETVASNAAYLREKLLLPLLDDGKNVVLVMHSFGGCVGSVAAAGLSKKDRGSSGGVVGLIFIAGFLAKESMSLFDALGGKFDDFVNVDETTGQLTLDNPTDVLFHDVPGDVAAKAAGQLKQQALSVLKSSSSAPAWQEEFYNGGRRGYIRATQDRCVPAAIQTMMLDKSGLDWNIKDIETSHSPYLSHPQETFDIINGMITAIWSQ